MKITIGICLVILSGCASTDKNVVTEYKPLMTAEQQVLRDGFVGKWRSEQPNKNGGTNITIKNMMRDGRYVNEFKVLDSSSKLKIESKEFGFWGVSGGIYFTMFKGWIENDELVPSDPTDVYNYDSYKIISFKPDELVYESLVSGNHYTYSRVK
ncbi:hypothetical protein [Psychrosphaera saromensis]|nr:hypothetical protein [Psychrosphaera saromensis]